MQQNYLESAKKQFAYYQLLGQQTFDQVTDEDLFWQYNAESNSMAIIINHLWGNMLSRWTDFLTDDGEKPWRKRDLEFESAINSREELMEKWHAGWECLFEALETISPSDLDRVVYIRQQGHTVVEAINRQLNHYAYHVGQIVYIGRMLRGKEWKSLSIPKGKSSTFNAEKFAQDKRRAHFTDEFLSGEKGSG